MAFIKFKLGGDLRGYGDTISVRVEKIVAVIPATGNGTFVRVDGFPEFWTLEPYEGVLDRIRLAESGVES